MLPSVDGMERGIPGLAFPGLSLAMGGRRGLLLLALHALPVLLALLLAPGLGFVAALLAALFCLGRYFAMAAYARGIDRKRWFLPLCAWIALLGLLALLLYLAGRKGLVFWPAMVALAGPTTFLLASLAAAIRGLAPGGPFRPLSAKASGTKADGGIP